MADRGKPTGPRAAKRGVWFFMRTVLLIAAFALLCYGIFTMAMNTTNLYILATEGLQLRAECILQDGPEEELRSYFTEAFLSKDALLATTVYDDYTITSFDYRISVESVRAWPWSKSATMVVMERMASMNGSILADKKPESAPEDAEYPIPEWESGKYRLYFSNRNGRWYIYQMTLLEAAPSEQPLRTPDMRMTPLPAYTTPPPESTPTPRPTATPSPSPTAEPEEGEEPGEE